MKRVLAVACASVMMLATPSVAHAFTPKEVLGYNLMKTMPCQLMNIPADVTTTTELQALLDRMTEQVLGGRVLTDQERNERDLSQKFVLARTVECGLVKEDRAEVPELPEVPPLFGSSS